MADYRGGDRHTSVHGDGLIKAIREGRTERQRSRNFNQKLLFTGVQAGLTAGRGIAGYVQHNADKADAKAKDKAAHDALPTPDYKPMKAEATDAKLPSWLTGGNGDRTELAVGNDVTSALKPAGSGNPYDAAPMVTRAEDALLNTAEAPVTWGTGAKSRDEDEYAPGKVSGGGWGDDGLTRRRGRGMMGSQ